MIKKFTNKALICAENARANIEEATASYRQTDNYNRGLLEAGKITKFGYDDSMNGFKEQLAGRIDAELSRINAVKSEFDELMDEESRLDGSKIDSGTVELLNSGIKLSSSDWQALADRFSDNATMTRLLQERYASRPIPKSLPDGFFTQGKEAKEVEVRFAKSPEKVKKAFDSFCDSLCRSVSSGSYLPEYGSQDSYWNHLARTTLEASNGYHGGSFTEAELDTDYPVTVVAPRQIIF
jgi:hypothetical protein